MSLPFSRKEIDAYKMPSKYTMDLLYVKKQMPSFKLQASKEFSKFYWYGASYFIFILFNEWRQCNPSIHSIRPKMHFIIVLIISHKPNKHYRAPLFVP
jgi:hypothetical protein